MLRSRAANLTALAAFLPVIAPTAIPTTATATEGSRGTLPRVAVAVPIPDVLTLHLTASSLSLKPRTGMKPAVTRKPVSTIVHHPTARELKIAKVIKFAKAQIGKWYAYSTAGPNTFDCSGLVVAAYRQIGISLPHQTGALHYRGRAVARGQLQPGDYVFLRPQNGTSGHVALYIGGGLVIEAPHSGARVRYNRLYAFYGARRVI